MLTEFTQVRSGEQLLTFLFSFLVGAVLCLIYDFFRCRRLVFPVGKIGLFFQDILYSSLCAVIIFCFLVIRCDGQFRYYVLFGTLIGWCLFRFTVSRWMVKAVVWLLHCFLTALHLCLHPIQSFITAVFKKISLWLTKAWKRIKNIYKRNKKSLEKETTVDV
ncbi:MAG: spore cortex biosynthesis protein YabQ [Clostridia bacterium]|nr:spore cortex biosynthesis protein YabQ [Clostridia bacterium]